MQVPISEIIVGHRNRSLGDIDRLIDSIRELGLLNPITITDDKRLIAGRHRLEACRKLGWKKVPAIIIRLDVLDRELAEIDENLIRNELTALEQALQIHRRKEIYEIKHPDTKNGANGGGRNGKGVRKKTENATIAFSEDTAKKTGKSRRTVETKASIGKKLKKKAKKIKGTVIENSQKDLLALSKMVDSEQDAVIEKIQKGEAKNVKQAKQAIQRQAKKDTAPNKLDHDRCRLIHAELADISQYIAESSIDVIITDPPYPREYLPFYEVLAEKAARVLKDGGLCVVMCGQSYLPDIYAMMSRHLTYHWTAAYLTPGGQAVQVFPRKVNTFWKPLLVYVKGQYDGKWFGDVTKSSVNDNDKEHHDWGQSVSGMLDVVSRFSIEGDLVLDPFTGAGTTGVACLKLNRRFIGIDRDEQSITIARSRLANA